ncbi:MAG: hypothetical protein ACHQ50_04185, partial [Fimbriimonadales bacterium]
SVVLVAVLFLTGGPTPRAAAAEFMSALTKGDVDKLTELSYVQNRTKDQIHQEWAEAVKYSQSYIFFWDISSTQQTGATSAVVHVNLTPDPSSESAYVQPKPLQLVKVDGAWKVEVAEITRDMYPYLPR